ncbi:MAG: hypothetical protein WCW27_06715 [Patescibacteria group bacterium]|jgi:hypothetical protein
MKKIFSFVLFAVLGVFGYVQASQAVSVELNTATSVTGLGTRVISLYVNDTNYAVVTSGDVLIYQLSNSAAPVLVGSYATPGTAYDVTASADGHYLYVADGSTISTTQTCRVVLGRNICTDNAPTAAGHALVLDISTISAPTLTADYSYNLGNFQAVELVGTTLYVSDIVNGIHVVDVATPSVPSQVNLLTTYTGVMDLVSSAGYLYALSATTTSVLVFNISSVTAPTQVGSGAASVLANRLRIDDGTLYIADGENGLVIYNVNNPATPTLVGVYNSTGLARGVTFANGIGYLADSYGGVVALNMNNVGNVSVIATSTATELNTANDVTYVGKYAYVLTNTALNQVYLNYDFTVDGSANGEKGDVTVYESGAYWSTIHAYTNTVGAQAKLGDVNNDGIMEIVTAPKGKMKQPKVQVYNAVTGTMLSSKKLDSSEDKTQFIIGVGDYYNPVSKAEIVAGRLMASGDNTALMLTAYFVKADNSIKKKTTVTENPTAALFSEEGYKIKIKSDKSYPIVVQAKETTDVKSKYKVVKNSDGSFSFVKKS